MNLLSTLRTSLFHLAMTPSERIKSLYPRQVIIHREAEEVLGLEYPPGTHGRHWFSGRSHIEMCAKRFIDILPLTDSPLLPLPPRPLSVREVMALKPECFADGEFPEKSRTFLDGWYWMTHPSSDNVDQMMMGRGAFAGDMIAVPIESPTSTMKKRGDGRMDESPVSAGLGEKRHTRRFLPAGR